MFHFRINRPIKATNHSYRYCLLPRPIHCFLRQTGGHFPQFHNYVALPLQMYYFLPQISVIESIHYEHQRLENVVSVLFRRNLIQSACATSVLFCRCKSLYELHLSYSVCVYIYSILLCQYVLVSLICRCSWSHMLHLSCSSCNHLYRATSILFYQYVLHS
jgi:hypothetical protein